MMIDYETFRNTPNALSNVLGTSTECERLKVENNKLHRYLEILKENGIEIVDAVAGGYEIYDERQRTLDRAEIENTKLRELVQGIIWCNNKPWNNSVCDDCPISGTDLMRCNNLIKKLRIGENKLNSVQFQTTFTKS